ncbi:MAG TPA: DNA mismatch repair endonuclease MutL [Saprospiraceae bacterium]|nr:DNA mismatch repair endonuclease MutL [Saprospiraceae bacterium]
MPDIIHLLPDNVVNQIAAGEVIQRPASVVKELMDNAIDSGATDIKLIVKDAGKTLIQINDNGCGMSPTDARMAFERHATSKIKGADDLFQIQTKGFRGEALASIAAVAQVEMKTKPASDSIGTKISISDSRVKSQEPCACPPGTQIQVKNLFYNIPARRKFLKTDAIELRHIHDEFIYQALSFPEITFSFYHNDNLVYQLAPGNLKQRIVSIYGKKYQDHLIPVSPQTDVLEISGFIGKPELAKKAKGEQILFVNRRFIRSPYLQHAVKSAYEQVIPPEHLPFYILFLNIDPTHIDINVHPTKNEIKFDDERLIYQFLKAAARYSLAQYSITPLLDFEGSNPGIENMMQNPVTTSVYPRQEGESHAQRSGSMASWVQLAYPADRSGTVTEWRPPQAEQATETGAPSQNLGIDEDRNAFRVYQLHASYLVVQLKSGITIIDQQWAHERVLYEYYKSLFQKGENPVQKLLFPQTIHLSQPDAQVLIQILPQLQQLGFELEDFGSDSFVIHGVPAILDGKYAEQELIMRLLNQYKQNLEFELSLEENLARGLAVSSSIKRGKVLQEEEMNSLVEQLFLCEIPYASPFGKKSLFHLSLDDLQKKFS